MFGRFWIYDETLSGSGTGYWDDIEPLGAANGGSGVASRSGREVRRRRPRSFAEKHTLALLAGLWYFGSMKAQFTYWQERDGRFLGYLNDYPDHWTQGESLNDLKENLRDLFQTFTSEQIPGIKKVEELEVA